VIAEQIKRSIKYHKSLTKDNSDRVVCVWDVGQFGKTYSLNFPELQNKKYVPSQPDSDAELQELASWFRRNDLVNFKFYQTGALHKQMFVIRHPNVESDEKVKTLLKSKHHKTGKDPFNTTLVLTSFSMLNLLCECAKFNWEVQASADGTHKISSANGFVGCLVGFGCISIARDGTRQWKPVAYAIGEGEREIVSLITFLNVKKAVQDIFGLTIPGFKGGLVSDHSPVFVNAFQYAFPTSRPLQCYTHIVRKFLCPKDRKDNGQYRVHLSNKDANTLKWLHSTALQDVRNLYKCRTKAQFLCYADLMHEGWVADGERELSEKFRESYILDEMYNKWWSTASSIPGYSPDNNPLESLNKQIKGCKDFRGIIEPGKSLQRVLNHELPKLIWWNSTERSVLTQYYPVVQEAKAFLDDRVLEIWKGFQYDIDVFILDSDKHGLSGYLVNDGTNLGECINTELVSKYARYLRGEYSDKDRVDLVDFVLRYHHIEKESKPSVGTVFLCTCKEYYQSRYCPMSAVMQHRRTLQEKGKDIRVEKKCSKRKELNGIMECVRRVRGKQKETGANLADAVGANLAEAVGTPTSNIIPPTCTQDM
jgi:hypothetical protein